MRSMLPTVWSSRCSVNVAALGTLVSFSKDILQQSKLRQASITCVINHGLDAACSMLSTLSLGPNPARATALDTHFCTPSGTTNFS